MTDPVDETMTLSEFLERFEGAPEESKSSWDIQPLSASRTWGGS